MKKFLSLILIFSLLFIVTSCKQQPEIKENNNRTTLQTQPGEPLTSPFEESTFESVTNETGGGTPTLAKYRSIYSDVPRPFINLVDIYEYQVWFEEMIKDDPNQTNVMLMKLFVQEFEISREDFDRANLEWAKIILHGFEGQPMMNPQDFANQETDEVYNADIIYTFDDAIINEYYLSHEYPYLYAFEFEQAVASGEYTPRTEVWVDVEAMEAEIIEKYGEAENVTEPINPQDLTWPPTTEEATEISE